MPVTFDGENLLVELPSATTTLDSQEDFYEPWKTWLKTPQADGTKNTKYPQLFRPIAGDPIVAGVLKYAGVFFMQNQNGWRMRLPDENITVTLTGNMALEDTSIDFFTPRSGKTGAILGLAAFVTNVSAMTELWQLEGLDSANPMTVTPTSRVAGDISQTISGDGDTTSTVTRT